MASSIIPVIGLKEIKKLRSTTIKNVVNFLNDYKEQNTSIKIMNLEASQQTYALNIASKIESVTLDVIIMDIEEARREMFEEEQRMIDINGKKF